jgi:hypothetical protein
LLGLPQVKRLLSNDHFSVDGTQLKAWASMKSPLADNEMATYGEYEALLLSP